MEGYSDPFLQFPDDEDYLILPGEEHAPQELLDPSAPSLPDPLADSIDNWLDPTIMPSSEVDEYVDRHLLSVDLTNQQSGQGEAVASTIEPLETLIGPALSNPLEPFDLPDFSLPMDGALGLGNALGQTHSHPALPPQIPDSYTFPLPPAGQPAGQPQYTYPDPTDDDFLVWESPYFIGPVDDYPIPPSAIENALRYKGPPPTSNPPPNDGLADRPASPTKKSRRQDKISSRSSSSSPGRPARNVAAVSTRYRVEKPKRDEAHAWVRTNETTQGKNCRSGKINQYDPKAVYKTYPHPCGDWDGPQYRFEYNKWGELNQVTYSADQLREFIYSHPSGKHARLKLWIQRSPADSARRYPTRDSSKCRFRDCPAHVARQNGTILHGHYRVAFDERWTKYRDNVDPFFVAGYVHLYCFERFLDFPDIIRNCNVEIDTRELPNEPRHEFAASLHHKPEGATAYRFLQICKQGPEAFAAEYPNYPNHAEYAAARTKKSHEGTLTRLMHETKHQTRSQGLKNTLEKRGSHMSKDSNHLGDLEIYIEARKEMNRQRAPPKRRMRDQPDADDSGDELFVASSSSNKKRKTSNDADDSRKEDQAVVGEPTRRSPRTRGSA